MRTNSGRPAKWWESAGVSEGSHLWSNSKRGASMSNWLCCGLGHKWYCTTHFATWRLPGWCSHKLSHWAGKWRGYTHAGRIGGWALARHQRSDSCPRHLDRRSRLHSERWRSNLGSSSGWRGSRRSLPLLDFDCLLGIAKSSRGSCRHRPLQGLQRIFSPELGQPPGNTF